MKRAVPIASLLPEDTATHSARWMRDLTPACRSRSAPGEVFLWTPDAVDCAECLRIGRGEALPQPYRACFECGERYGTPDELRAAYRRAVTASLAMWSLIDPLVIPLPEDIHFCQECLHDF